MWLLFELGLVFSRFFKPREDPEDQPELLQDQGSAPAESIRPANDDDR
jgi:Sec-independent protein secretion pathway component TatC